MIKIILEHTDSGIQNKTFKNLLVSKAGHNTFLKLACQSSNQDIALTCFSKLNKENEFKQVATKSNLPTIKNKAKDRLQPAKIETKKIINAHQEGKYLWIIREIETLFSDEAEVQEHYQHLLNAWKQENKLNPCQDNNLTVRFKKAQGNFVEAYQKYQSKLEKEKSQDSDKNIDTSREQNSENLKLEEIKSQEKNKKRYSIQERTEFFQTQNQKLLALLKTNLQELNLLNDKIEDNFLPIEKECIQKIHFYQNTRREIRSPFLTEEQKQSLAKIQADYQKVATKFYQTQEWYQWHNLKEKQELCTKLENALQERPESPSLFLEECKTQWYKIKFVPREEKENIETRFKQAKENIKETYKQELIEYQESQKENIESREKIIQSIQQLLETENFKENLNNLKRLQDKWKGLPLVSFNKYITLQTQYRLACKNFYNQLKVHRKQMQEEEKKYIRIKQDLCSEAEQLVGFQYKENAFIEFHSKQNWKEVVQIIQELRIKWQAVPRASYSNEQKYWKRFLTVTHFAYNLSNANDKSPSWQENESIKNQIYQQLVDLQETAINKTLINNIKQLQQDWEASPPILPDKFKLLFPSFNTLCQSLYKKYYKN